MKSSRVYIKANYIKKAKNDWIYCDAQILKQNNISMLKLSSINLKNDDKEDTLSRISSFSTVSANNRWKTLHSSDLKVLCNLSEFKSSEIKSVNFYNTEKFGIKLVPSGILNSKKLFLIPENEEDLTKWCNILGEHIYKSIVSEIKTQTASEMRDDKSTTLKMKDSSDREAYSTIKSRKELEKELIEAEKMVFTLKKNQITADVGKYNDDKCSMIPNSPVSCNSYKSEEVYFAMDDNDVYETTPTDNIYTVCVEESADSKNKGIRGSYLMKLNPEGIELCDIKKGEAIHEFPYIFIRRFGAKNDLLRLEAGRKCSTGEGYFVFRFKDAGKAVTTIKELVKELKSSKALEIDHEDSGSNRHSIAATSRNSASFECSVDVTLNKSSKTSTSSENNSSPSHSSGSCSPKSISPNVANVVTVNSPSHDYSTVKRVPHPLYNSISGIPNGRSPQPVSTATNSVTLQTSKPAATNRAPVVNNAFNRNQYASSFTYRRPPQANIPVIKDDNSSRGVIYDNVPLQQQNSNQLSCQSLLSTKSRSMQNPPSNLQFTSSYTLKGSLANTVNGQYDNVPNNQRCIKELETMLMDLGIPTN